MPNDLTFRVIGCARCSQDHEVTAVAFKHAGVGEFTHWAPCPVTGEPILVRFEDDDVTGPGIPANPSGVM